MKVTVTELSLLKLICGQYTSGNPTCLSVCLQLLIVEPKGGGRES